jgi:hypothetical protein
LLTPKSLFLHRVTWFAGHHVETRNSFGEVVRNWGFYKQVITISVVCYDTSAVNVQYHAQVLTEIYGVLMVSWRFFFMCMAFLMISLNLTSEVKEREHLIGLPLYISAPCQEHLKQMYRIMSST